MSLFYYSFCKIYFLDKKINKNWKVLDYFRTIPKQIVGFITETLYLNEPTTSHFFKLEYSYETIRGCTEIKGITI